MNLHNFMNSVLHLLLPVRYALTNPRNSIAILGLLHGLLYSIALNRFFTVDLEVF